MENTKFKNVYLFSRTDILKSVNVSDLVGKLGSYSNPVILSLRTWPSLAIGLTGTSPVPVRVQM